VLILRLTFWPSVYVSRNDLRHQAENKNMGGCEACLFAMLTLFLLTLPFEQMDHLLICFARGQIKIDKQWPSNIGWPPTCQCVAFLEVCRHFNPCLQSEFAYHEPVARASKATEGDWHFADTLPATPEDVSKKSIWACVWGVPLAILVHSAWWPFLSIAPGGNDHRNCFD